MASRNDSSPLQMTRRQLLAGVAGGTAAFTVSSALGEIPSAEAHARATGFKNLTVREGALLEALGDVLLPGAAKAGIAHYVDDQLGRSQPLLFLRYMDYPASCLEFYRQGLAALDDFSKSRYKHPFTAASQEQKVAIIQEMSRNNPDGWSGPPAPLFYLVVRNDATDVYYGTPQGFERLEVPYAALLKPPHDW